MNRNAAILAALGVASCTTTSPDPTPVGREVSAMEMASTQTAAEAVIVEHNVPEAAVESGLVNDETQVCRKEHVVGSHIPKLVCLSAKDRERLQNTSQGYMDAAKRTPEPKNSEGL